MKLGLDLLVKLLMWILTGVVATKIMQSKSSWWINLIVGALGGVLGGLLFGLFYSGGVIGWVLSFAGGVVGACILIFVAKMLKIMK